jgi:23S rRNA-/tRNA-specific pseudouridylate synthase
MADQLESDQEMTESDCVAEALSSSQIIPKQSRRAEIIVEFNQVVVIKKPEGLVIQWCPVR